MKCTMPTIKKETRWVNIYVLESLVIVSFQILATCFIRKIMDYIFTQSELFWLDHLLPEEHRRKEDDRKKAEREKHDQDRHRHHFLHIRGHDTGWKIGGHHHHGENGDQQPGENGQPAHHRLHGILGHSNKG